MTERCLLLVFISALYRMSFVILFLISYFRFIRTENNQPKSPTRKKKPVINDQKSRVKYIYNKLYFGIMFVTIMDMHSKYIVWFPLPPNFRFFCHYIYYITL